MFIIHQTFVATHAVFKNCGMFSDVSVSCFSSHSQLLLEKIWSRDAFRLIACEQKYLMKERGVQHLVA